MRSLPFILALMVVVGGFTYFNSESAHYLPQAGQYDRYFPTPQASVDMATKLMAAGDWAVLESYYDLAAVPAASRSAVANLMPFPLGATFVSARTLENDEVEVTVAVASKEPETGSLIYRLKAHPEGYKLLPTR